MVKQSDRATDPEGRPVLFPDTAICADCGELYTNRGLVKRCKERHERRDGVTSNAKQVKR